MGTTPSLSAKRRAKRDMHGHDRAPSCSAASGKALKMQVSLKGEGHVKQGFLKKRGHKHTTWKKRWCELLPGGVMHYYKVRNGVKLPGKGAVHFGFVTKVAVHYKDSRIFRATTDGDSTKFWEFMAASAQNTVDWIEAIRPFMGTVKKRAPPTKGLPPPPPPGKRKGRKSPFSLTKSKTSIAEGRMRADSELELTPVFTSVSPKTRSMKKVREMTGDDPYTEPASAGGGPLGGDTPIPAKHKKHKFSLSFRRRKSSAVPYKRGSILETKGRFRADSLAAMDTEYISFTTFKHSVEQLLLKPSTTAVPFPESDRETYRKLLNDESKLKMIFKELCDGKPMMSMRQYTTLVTIVKMRDGGTAEMARELVLTQKSELVSMFREKPEMLQLKAVLSAERDRDAATAEGGDHQFLELDEDAEMEDESKMDMPSPMCVLHESSPPMRSMPGDGGSHVPFGGLYKTVSSPPLRSMPGYGTPGSRGTRSSAISLEDSSIDSTTQMSASASVSPKIPHRMSKLAQMHKDLFSGRTSSPFRTGLSHGGVGGSSIRSRHSVVPVLRDSFVGEMDSVLEGGHFPEDSFSSARTMSAVFTPFSSRGSGGFFRRETSDSTLSRSSGRRASDLFGISRQSTSSLYKRCARASISSQMQRVSMLSATSDIFEKVLRKRGFESFEQFEASTLGAGYGLPDDVSEAGTVVFSDALGREPSEFGLPLMGERPSFERAEVRKSPAPARAIFPSVPFPSPSPMPKTSSGIASAFALERERRQRQDSDASDLSELSTGTFRAKGSVCFSPGYSPATSPPGHGPELSPDPGSYYGSLATSLPPSGGLLFSKMLSSETLPDDTSMEATLSLDAISPDEIEEAIAMQLRAPTQQAEMRIEMPANAAGEVLGHFLASQIGVCVPQMDVVTSKDTATAHTLIKKYGGDEFDVESGEKPPTILVFEEINGFHLYDFDLPDDCYMNERYIIRKEARKILGKDFPKKISSVGKALLRDAGFIFALDVCMHNTVRFPVTQPFSGGEGVPDLLWIAPDENNEISLYALETVFFGSDYFVALDRSSHYRYLKQLPVFFAAVNSYYKNLCNPSVAVTTKERRLVNESLRLVAKFLFTHLCRVFFIDHSDPPIHGKRVAAIDESLMVERFQRYVCEGFLIGVTEFGDICVEDVLAAMADMFDLDPDMSGLEVLDKDYLVDVVQMCEDHAIDVDFLEDSDADDDDDADERQEESVSESSSISETRERMLLMQLQLIL